MDVASSDLRRGACSRWLGAVLALLVAATAAAQRWAELQGRTKSGQVALHQAVLDATTDVLVLVVASHPDDRYVLPAIYLRYRFGARVAVLVASRGGGGQNSLGPETGDALERIRTLEAEAGVSQFDGELYWLNRPDRGFRRTAAETWAEWGREQTITEMVRMLRQIRPDIVVTTHNAEETHGHDLAIAEALPEAVERAADAGIQPGAPHRVRALFLGDTNSPSATAVAIDTDAFEPIRGATFRRLGYEILLRHHQSPGPPAPIDTLFAARMAFAPADLFGDPAPTSWIAAAPDLLATEVFPGDAEAAAALRECLDGLPRLLLAREQLAAQAAAALRRLTQLSTSPNGDLARRVARRVEALHRVIRHAAAIQIEAEARPGAVAVPGEELDLDVRVHVGGPLAVANVRASAGTGDVTFEPIDGEGTHIDAGGELHAALTYRVPLLAVDARAQDERFRTDRYEAPVQFVFACEVAGVDVPVPLIVPVDVRPAVELDIVPRTLLLPTTSRQLQFAVKVERNSAFPIDRELEVRYPAGYRVDGPRVHVRLDSARRDIFEFSLTAPPDRRSGVDIVRVVLGDTNVALRVHKVDVTIDRQLRIGLVRSMDDAVPSVLGAGGFGLQWTGLGDGDLAVGDLSQFDTIVVDVRALRDRPQARQSFRRVLDFCQHRGKRLVLFYHKDSEFEPSGDGFRGAPFQPFEIGRARVTRPDTPVELLRPDHVLFCQPNVLRTSDWDGWEQERGLYFPSVWSEAYEELLQLQDPGQPPQRSALLYVRCGEGEYVYCSLALWRQLKKMHEGAVRLLANLLTPSAQGS